MEVVLSINSPDRCYVDTWEVRFITSEIWEVVPIDRQSEEKIRSRQVSHHSLNASNKRGGQFSELQNPRSRSMSFSNGKGKETSDRPSVLASGA